MLSIDSCSAPPVAGATVVTVVVPVFVTLIENKLAPLASDPEQILYLTRISCVSVGCLPNLLLPK